MINNTAKVTTVDRYERMWEIGNNLDTNAFLIAISRSNFAFTESYNARNVNTIYFDDTKGCAFMQETKETIADGITLALNRGFKLKPPIKGVGFRLTFAKIHQISEISFKLREAENPVQ